MIRLLAMIALVIAVGPLGGCGGGECTGPNCTPTLDASPGSPWSIEHAFFLPGGSFAEAQLEMKSGDEVEVEFSIDGEPIEWNVHGHESNGDPIYYETGTDTAAMYTFTAPADGFFFTMWENTGVGVVRISVKLKLAASTKFVAWF